MLSISKFLKGFRLSFSFIALAVLFAVSGVAAIANAQGPDPAATPASPTAPGSQADTAAESARGPAAERAPALPARAQARITNLAANMSNRMDAAIARLQNVINRLESRIAKVAATGADTSAAELSLANAKTELDRARSQIATIDTTVNETVSSAQPRQAWRTLRTTFLSIRDNILSSHEALRNTVANLRVALESPASDPSPEAAPPSASTTTDAQSTQ